MNINSNLYKSILGIMFIAFLSVVVLLNIIEPDRVFSESENRMLQQVPKFSLNSLIKGSFSSDYEKYITDQIALRDFWIGVKASSERIIGKRDNNGVYLGKDGYLLQNFKKPDGQGAEKSIEAINTFVSSNPDLKLYFMLVPNSVKILKEKLPAFASQDDQLEYIDSVKKNLNSNIKFINIYETLATNKNEYIYYRTDHHWTTKGAYYAYKKFGQSIGIIPHEESYFDIVEVTNNFYGSLYSKSGFRNLKPDSIELYIPKNDEKYNIWYADENEHKNSLYEMGNIQKKDKYTVFLDGNHSHVKIKTNSDVNKSILIVKDSFANSFIPFLTDHYDEIYVVDLRYYSDSLKELIDSNGIREVLILYSVNTFVEDDSIRYISW